MYMNRHDAYLALLDRHRPLVWRMCWLRARGDWERCRDLVQEVSIALWLQFDKLRPEASPGEERAWVRWLTRSTLDHLHRRPSPTLLSLSEAMAANLAEEPSHAEEIDEILAALSPDDQRLVKLHLEGYCADEIAERMGLGRDAVYQRMHRAIARAKRVVAVLLMLVGASTLAVALVPQWRATVFRTEPAPEPVEVVEEPAAPVPASAPAPALPAMEEAPTDSAAPTPAWVAPEPLPYLLPAAPTLVLPDPPELRLEPEVGAAYSDGRLTLTGLREGELVVVRNFRGVLVALKRSHGSRCTIELPDAVGCTYILQIGNRPNRIRIEL